MLSSVTETDHHHQRINDVPAAAYRRARNQGAIQRNLPTVRQDFLLFTEVHIPSPASQQIEHIPRTDSEEVLVVSLLIRQQQNLTVER